MLEIKAEVDDNRIQVRLSQAISKMKNLDELLTEWGDLGELEAKMSFTREATPGGAAWPDLAASTWRQKTSGAIRRETGAAAGSYAAMPPRGDSVEVKSEGIPYEIYHHTGTSRMPQRRALPMPDYLRPKLLAIGGRYLRQVLQ